jgi:O-antigen ligase
MVWWLIVSTTAWISLFFVVVTLAPPIAAGVGNSGVHPSLLVAAAGVAIGALRLREWRFPLGTEGRALVIFAAVLLVSLAPAAILSGTDIAAQSFARVGLFCISVFVFLYVSAGPGRDAVVPLRLVYGVALVQRPSRVSISTTSSPPRRIRAAFVWLETGVFRRAQGLFYEATELGSFCAFFLVMTAVALVHRVGNRLLLIPGGAVFAAALIFSYSRSAVLNLAIALVALVALERARPVVRRLVAWLAGALVAGAVIASQVVPALFDLYLLRWWNSAAAALLSGDERALGNRVEAWRILLRFLSENPLHALFGVGYKTLPYSDYIGQPVIADNMYLSMLVETGVIGLAALVLLNVTILRAGYRAARSGDPTRIVLRRVDLLLLGGRIGADAVRRFAHLLARAAAVLLGPGDGGSQVRILFLEQFSEPGGGQRCMLDLASRSSRTRMGGVGSGSRRWHVVRDGASRRRGNGADRDGSVHQQPQDGGRLASIHARHLAAFKLDRGADRRMRSMSVARVPWLRRRAGPASRGGVSCPESAGEEVRGAADSLGHPAIACDGDRGQPVHRGADRKGGGEPVARGLQRRARSVSRCAVSRARVWPRRRMADRNHRTNRTGEGPDGFSKGGGASVAHVARGAIRDLRRAAIFATGVFGRGEATGGEAAVRNAGLAR